MKSVEQLSANSLAIGHAKRTTSSILIHLTRLRRKLRDDYHLWEALFDLAIAYFPIILVAWFLYASGNSTTLLLGRSDLMLLTAVLFAEGGSTTRRSISIHPVFSYAGFGAAVLLAGFALYYEIAAQKGVVSEAVFSFVHMPEYQIAQMICAIAGLSYGLYARILIYRAMDGKKKVSKEYDLAKTIEFYNLVAGDYNYDYQARPNFQETHKAIESQISVALKSMGNTNGKRKVLDLGGGTGLLAVPFRTREDIEWTACEPSSSMRKLYEDAFKESAGLQPKIESWKVDEATGNLKGQKFDVIVLSFVLSSLSKFPDFVSLKSLLSDSGVLILADVDRAEGETDEGESGPSLRITLDKGRGKAVELKLAQLHTWELISEMTKAGLDYKRTLFIKKDHVVSYAFVAVFSNS